MFKKWFTAILALVLGNIFIYHAIAFIQWNWNFNTWHWLARLMFVLLSIGTVNNFIKELNK